MVQVDTTSEFKNENLGEEGMNDVNFVVVQSPGRRNNTQYIAPSKDAASKLNTTGMVPQEQYDALKARFIENETTTQRRLESINDLESTIQRREQQIANMEKMFLTKTKEAENELETFKQAARETDKAAQGEIK